MCYKSKLEEYEHALKAFLTGAFGLLSLISLALPRPISFYAGRYMYAHTPEQIAYYNAGWRLPYVRFGHRLSAIVWGLAFLNEMSQTIVVLEQRRRN